MRFNNPFEKTRCNNCGCEFDAFASYCPECDHKNHGREDLKPLGEDKIIGVKRELLCFFVGWLGVVIMSMIASAIIRKLDPNTTSPVIINIIVNCSVYGTLLISLIAIIFPKFESIFSNFATKDTVKFLLVALAIVVFDLTWSYVSGLIGGTVNQNQSAVEDMIKFNPFISIVLMGIIGPICEEVTYRLGLFSFVSRINKVLAYAFVAIFFAFIHMHDITSVNEWLAMPSYVFAGLAFSFAYDHWGLGSSILAHVLVNLTSIFTTIL